MDDDPAIKNRAARIVRIIEVELTQAYGEFGKTILLTSATTEYLQQCMLDYLEKYFDIHARAYLPEITKYEDVEKRYAPILVEFAEQGFAHSEKMREDWEILGHVSVRGLAPVLFQARILHWRSLALKQVTGNHRATESESPVVVSSAPKKTRHIFEANHELLANLNGTLSRAKAAEALGMSPRNFDRLKETKKIVPVGPTKRKRYLIRDLQLIATQKHKSSNRDK